MADESTADATLDDGPDPAQLAKFRELRQAVRDANDGKESDGTAEKALEDFVKETRFGNEAPSEDFPELADKGKP